MPAKSRSQQRLFGMVHAYNKGELHCSRSLRRRIEEIAGRISDEDAGHFARTKHDDLPEKRAQMTFSPDQVRDLYGYLPSAPVIAASLPRAKRRRGLLSHLMRGSAVGAVAGGLGLGALGAFLTNKALVGSGVDPSEIRRRMLYSGLRLGTIGASRGAGLGALGGGAFYAIDRIRGEEQ